MRSVINRDLYPVEQVQELLHPGRHGIVGLVHPVQHDRVHRTDGQFGQKLNRKSRAEFFVGQTIGVQIRERVIHSLKLATGLAIVESNILD